MTRLSIALALGIVPASLLIATGAPAVAKDRPIYSKGALSGYLVGGCSKAVKLRIEGPERKFFTADNPDVRPLVVGLTTLMRQQCPRMESVEMQGYVGNDVVYSAFAEKSGRWTYYTSGPGRDRAQSSEGIGLGNALADARKRYTLMSSTDIAAQAKAGKKLCIDPKDGSCTYELTFDNFGKSGGLMRSRYMINGGAQAVASTRTSVRGGDAFCSDPSKASNEIRGGNLSASGRSAMSAQLAEQGRSVQAPVCYMVATKGDRTAVVIFDGAGAEVSKMTYASFIPGQAKLRRRD